MTAAGRLKDGTDTQADHEARDGMGHEAGHRHRCRRAS
jgi:hypothetical protein